MRRRTYLRTVAAGGTVVAGIGANASDTVVQTAAAQSSDGWSQQAKLTADDGDRGDRFGGFGPTAVALDGNRTLVGAYNDDDPDSKEDGTFTGAGSAYLFERGDESWTQQAKLIADESEAGDIFGRSVALDGQTALIGAPGDKGPNGGGDGDFDAGAAYVFEQSGETWSQEKKFTADEPNEFIHFGRSVALENNRALIGAEFDEDSTGEKTGAAYVFEKYNGEWKRETKLLANDGDLSDNFGFAVALDGDHALIGAFCDEDPNGFCAGSAYVFERETGDWSQQAKLTAADGDRQDQFGFRVALDGETALVGAFDDEDPNGEDSGSAYVFERTDGSWSQVAKLAPEESSEDDRFSSSVAVNGETIVIGAHHHDDPNGTDAGAAFVFERIAGEWQQTAKLAADDGDGGDLFGSSVALDRETALVGAGFDEDPNGEDAGSAYVFTSGDGSDRDSSLAPYTNENGVVDSQGLLDAAADFRAGDIDAGTLLDVAAAFRSGEPVT